jgi:CHAT domain-containing protein
MSERCCWRWHAYAGKRTHWGALLAACLLASCQQASEPTYEAAQQDARNEINSLLQRAQDEVGRRPTYLPQALARIQLGLEQTRQDPLQHGQWLYVEWFYHLLNDDHVRARDTLDEALRQLTAAGADVDLIANVTCSLSYSLIMLGEVARAKELLRRAIVLAGPSHNDVVLAELYYNLGDAYRKTGERLVARRYFEAAYELDKTAGDASKASMSELKLGSLARDAGEYAEAVARHERALAQFRRDRNYRELVTEIELALDHAALNDLDRAEQHAQRALRDDRALLEQRIDAHILLLRALNDRRTRGDSTQAIAARGGQLVTRIRSMLGASSSDRQAEFARPMHQLQFAEQAIRHYALERDLEQVASHGRSAIHLALSVAAGLRATNDDTLAWLTGAQPTLNEYVKALYELDTERVFPLLEAYYGRHMDPATLRHSGVIGRAYEAQAVELFEHYRAAERALIDATAEYERLRLYAKDAAQLAAMQRRLGQQSQFRDLARDGYLALYTAQPMAELPARLDAVESYRAPPLPATDVFIRYFVQENVSFGVVLAGREIEYFDIPRRSQVLASLDNALAVLQSPSHRGSKHAPLSDLAKLLPLKFLARHPGATRLVIVPDDAVQRVPFAAIDLAPGSQPYAPLVSRFEIVRTKSASRYYAPEQNSRRAADATLAAADIVVFGNPRLGAPPAQGLKLRKAPGPSWNDRLPTLPNTQKEAASIARAFSSRTVKTYLDLDATNDVLLSPGVRAAPVLHIATHGYFSAATPDIVGLATSPTRSEGRSQGGFLGLTELFTAPFASRLVVISGCETMRGRDYSGWGVQSLADGFLTQGAGSVLGTLWSISDDATAELMDAFYRELFRSDGNSSFALRAAQRELLASERFAHPYYWAGMVLESANIGVDRRVL